MVKEKHFVLVSPQTYAGPKSDRGFTYSSATPIEIGTVVKVPLGRKNSLGVVMETAPKPDFATKEIAEDLKVRLPKHLIELAKWMQNYYASTMASIWQTMLPSGMTRKRRSKDLQPVKTKPLKLQLTPEQSNAIEAISRGPERAYLLHGVTGSGKTQVYIELAKRNLASGRSVIILIPEIALSPQTVANFEAEFGSSVVASNSRMTEALRHQAWQKALSTTKPSIVIGPRSVLFAPLPNIGLIAIDECHETSYKQGQMPRYHATAAAAKLASLTGAKLVLGSATPSLSELWLAKQGRLKLLPLTSRISQSAPPNITLIDLRRKELLTRSEFLAKPLIESLTGTLANQRQSLLFINRRGSASSVICGDCGQVIACPHCRLPLTFHADAVKLICHYCNFRQAPPASCPACSSLNIRYVGLGTKRVESEIKRLFPTARVARLDRDSATLLNLTNIYAGLRQGKIDILIGTQMIAKGLDLPAIDTVGIVSADTMLHLADYTASERTFQLIKQVSGRAGRGNRPGQIFIQSYTPDHPAITAAAYDQYEAFAAAELNTRKLLGYPPYRYLLKLSFSGSSRPRILKQAESLLSQLSALPDLEILGPAPALREHAGGKLHWQIIVKSRQRQQLIHAATLTPPGWAVDLDPINLL